MDIERHRKGPPDKPDDARGAAMHIARYALASTVCAGKRVLDVACGEGYGPVLLRRWGAARVVGVDVADETIATAPRRSADPAIEYLCCDANALLERLGAEAQFDLIVSFAAVGCVPDPKRLLQNLRALLAAGGVMLVSCPNNRIAAPDDDRNLHQPAAPGFDDFRRLCEQAIGPVAQWMVETPALGAVQIPLDQLVASSEDVPALLQDKNPGHALLLPPQADLRPSLEDCLGYIAIWGGKVSSVAAMSPVSCSGRAARRYRIQALERVEAELARMQQAIENMQIENRRLLAEQQEDRRQLLIFAEQAAECGASQRQLDAVLDSTAWKVTYPFRRVGARLPRTAQTLRIVWRSAPLKLWSKLRRSSLARRP